MIASEGSRTCGQLVCTPGPRGRIDENARIEARQGHTQALESVLARSSVDVVHFHGHDFDRYLPRDEGRVLATIHLPPELLVADLRAIERRAFWAHGVSQEQQSRLPQRSFLLPPIENGVPDSHEAMPLICQFLTTCAIG